MIIGHYTAGLFYPGGVGNYIRRVSRAQRELGHTTLFFDQLSRATDEGRAAENVHYVQDDADLLATAARLGVEILHIHYTVEIPPRCPLPVIRTLHGHEPYCPSGSRYHKFQQRPCNRTYSVAGCLWGHFASHCGSVRPKSLLNEFRRTWREMHSLPRIPVITVSEFLKKEMLRAGYSGDAIHVLRTYAPDPKPYSPPAQEGAPRFAFIGRMTPEKGVAWFLRSIQKVKIPIQVDIAGEGPSEAELRALTVQLGLHDRVTFHGWVNAEKVHALLGGARSLVFPSIWHEPGGAVAGEAMVNGRAVIMSRVGGMPEYVRHEVNGLLVNPNDVEELTGAIERLATDWELARSLGETGRQIAQEQFSFQGHVQRLGCLYAQTISEYESLGK